MSLDTPEHEGFLPLLQIDFIAHLSPDATTAFLSASQQELIRQNNLNKNVRLDIRADGIVGILQSTDGDGLRVDDFVSPQVVLDAINAVIVKMAGAEKALPPLPQSIEATPYKIEMDPATTAELSQLMRTKVAALLEQHELADSLQPYSIISVPYHQGTIHMEFLSPKGSTAKATLNASTGIFTLMISAHQKHIFAPNSREEEVFEESAIIPGVIYRHSPRGTTIRAEKTVKILAKPGDLKNCQTRQ